MEIPIGDLLDRMSISRLKCAHIGESQCFEEYETYRQAFESLLLEHPILQSYAEQLLEINAEIWSYESDLRQGHLEKYDTSCIEVLSQESLLQLAAVGLAAVRIRNANRRRKTLINQLVEMTKTGWRDVKCNHASE
jgi:hypothetical protein